MKVKLQFHIRLARTSRGHIVSLRKKCNFSGVGFTFIDKTNLEQNYAMIALKQSEPIQSRFKIINFLASIQPNLNCRSKWGGSKWSRI